MRDLLLKLYPKSLRSENGDALRGVLEEGELTSAIIVGITGAIW